MAGGGQHDDDADADNVDTYADDVDADGGDRDSEAGNIYILFTWYFSRSILNPDYDDDDNDDDGNRGN